jgi:short-subunit dehydrogenase
MNRGARKEAAALGGMAAAALALMGCKTTARTLGALAAAAYLWPARGFSYRGKVVAITGGSRGLGFALARNLVKAGAKVALLARDEVELERARILLSGDPRGTVMVIPCDVTRPTELKDAVGQILREHGTLDIWINDAGAILVGPLTSMTEEDLDAVLATQVRAVWSSMQEVRPIFQKAGGGKFINISSIGGKIAVPHLGIYSTAKFALAGLSAAMNAELAAQNIHVTTVFPGLMRVGSAIQAVVKGDHEKEFAWFALGTVTPLISVSADDAARRILQAAARGDAQLIFPTTMKAAVLAQTAFPELSAWASRRVAKWLPAADSTIGKTGAQSKGVLEKLPGGGFVSKAMKAQEVENNEVEKADARFNLGLESSS